MKFAIITLFINILFVKSFLTEPSKEQYPNKEHYNKLKKKLDIILEEHLNNDIHFPNPYLIGNKRNLVDLTYEELAQSKDFKNIRIFVDSTTLYAQTGISEEYKSKLIEIIEFGVKIVQILIKVKPRKLNLNVKECHPEVQINYAIEGIGIQADLVVFPIINNAAKKDNIIQAKYCSLDQENSRPIAGYLSFNSMMKFDKKNSFEYYTLSVIHGMFHILGFDEDLFDKFIDKKKNIKISKDNFALEIRQGKIGIVSPLAISTAKYYFNCTSIIEIPISVPSKDKTVTTHWEGRLMLGDIMTDSAYNERFISEITLAFMEDTGWYEANYFTGGLFRYGKGGQCKFALGKCVNNGQVSNKNEFCTDSNFSMCSPGRYSRGKCFIRNDYTKIKNSFQYFNLGNMGGPEISEYCPVSIGFEKADSYFDNSCSKGSLKFDKTLGEVVGEETSCFMTNLVRKTDEFSVQVIKSFEAACFEYKCDYENFVYSVRFRGKWIECPNEGIITTSETDGQLQCPQFSLICTKLIECSDLIDCVLKKSTVFYRPDIEMVFQKNNQILKNEENQASYFNSTTPIESEVEGEAVNIVVAKNNFKNDLISSFLRISFALVIVLILIN